MFNPQMAMAMMAQMAMANRQASQGQGQIQMLQNAAQNTTPKTKKNKKKNA